MADFDKEPWNLPPENSYLSAPQVEGKPWESFQGDTMSYLGDVPLPKPKTPMDKVFDNLVQAESNGVHRNKDGTLLSSKAGALGITQIMPATARQPGYGIKPLQNDSEEEYLRMGRDLLNAMYRVYDGDIEKALAAYNAGPGNVDKAVAKGGRDWKQHLPRKQETLPYIDKILSGIKKEDEGLNSLVGEENA